MSYNLEELERALKAEVENKDVIMDIASKFSVAKKSHFVFATRQNPNQVHYFLEFDLSMDDPAEVMVRFSYTETPYIGYYDSRVETDAKMALADGVCRGCDVITGEF